MTRSCPSRVTRQEKPNIILYCPILSSIVQYCPDIVQYCSILYQMLLAIIRQTLNDTNEYFLHSCNIVQYCHILSNSIIVQYCSILFKVPLLALSCMSFNIVILLYWLLVFGSHLLSVTCHLLLGISLRNQLLLVKSCFLSLIIFYSKYLPLCFT